MPLNLQQHSLACLNHRSVNRHKSLGHVAFGLKDTKIDLFCTEFVQVTYPLLFASIIILSLALNVKLQYSCFSLTHYVVRLTSHRW